jgi:hypothetical protein
LVLLAGEAAFSTKGGGNRLDMIVDVTEQGSEQCSDGRQRARSCERSRLNPLVPAGLCRLAPPRMAYAQLDIGRDTREDGIMQFATSVRTALSNEPARRWFEDQVSDGFKYLDDYFFMITSGSQEQR